MFTYQDDYQEVVEHVVKDVTKNVIEESGIILDKLCVILNKT